jgi:hypothetical protein
LMAAMDVIPYVFNGKKEVSNDASLSHAPGTGYSYSGTSAPRPF